MAIILNNITKLFNGKEVLFNLSAEFQEGKTTCIMGASGAGKTTLVCILLGLLKADCGEITGIKNKRKAAVFQEDRLIGDIDAIENVRIISNKISRQQVSDAFVQVGLTDYKNKPVHELSGGMKRRIAIVRALLSESDLLILDEPFKGLDEHTKVQTIEFIRRTAIGKTMLLVTHDKADAEAFHAELFYLENVSAKERQA